MNIKKYTVPAMLAASGYGFFIFDHWHRSILEHGYHAGLFIAGALAVGVLTAQHNKPRQQDDRDEEIAQKPYDVHLIEHEPQQGHKLKTSRRERVQS